MCPLYEADFLKSHSGLQLLPSKSGVYFSTPSRQRAKAGLRQRACFDQWDIGKQHKQRIKKYTVGFSLSYCWETFRIHWNKFRPASYRKKDNVERSSRHPVISGTSAVPTEHPRLWFLNLQMSTFLLTS